MRAVFTFLIVAFLSLNGFAATVPTPIIIFKFDKLEYLLTDYAVIWSVKDADGIVTEWKELVIQTIETPDLWLFYTKNNRYQVAKDGKRLDIKAVGATSLEVKTYFVQQ